MSLLKRLLGIDSGGDDDESNSPTIARIAEALDGMPKERAHYIAAFAYVLARTAHADLRIEDSEVEAMNRATASLGDLNDDEAKLAVEIALSQTREEGGTANYLVTRKFRDMSTRETALRTRRMSLCDLSCGRQHLHHRERRGIQDRGRAGTHTPRNERTKIRLEGTPRRVPGASEEVNCANA